MKKIMILLLLCLAITVRASTILWAALDENSVINTGGSSIPFREYVSGTGQFVNAARLVAEGNPIPLWIPEYEGEPGYWEEDFPVVCLQGPDGEPWEMPRFSSQFNMGENPDNSMTVIFELGYVSDWDDESSPFMALATTQLTYGQLDSEKHIYPAGTLNPPIEADWMPTIFYADIPVPEPSIFVLVVIGMCVLLLRRGNAEQV